MTRSLVMTAAVTALVALAQPAAAGGVVGGVKTCNSWLPDAHTYFTAPKSKKCGGGFDGCLTSFSTYHHTAKAAVIDFREEGFTGDVWTAVMPNDSRLPVPTPGGLIQPRKLGDLEDGEPKDSNGIGLTDWYIPFSGLRPEHYYAFIIYHPDANYGFGPDVKYGFDKPFERLCFLTTKHPDDCPEDAYRSRDGTKRC